jgi:hypothetical protein
LLGKAYLQVTRAILYHEITFTVIQYPMVESRSETMIVPHLKLKHILLKSIASILFPKIEKRQFDQVPDPIKKPRQETRILQASYLICEPTVPDNYLYPENSLGAMYCQVNEKQLFGRVYGMNVEDQVVNSPRKKQRV